jgi:hypothetical protein
MGFLTRTPDVPEPRLLREDGEPCRHPDQGEVKNPQASALLESVAQFASVRWRELPMDGTDPGRGARFILGVGSAGASMVLPDAEMVEAAVAATGTAATSLSQPA